MSEDTSIWYALELDPGTAAFFSLPPRFHLPAVAEGQPVSPAERFSLPDLARALEQAVAANPEVAGRAEIHRFLKRWKRYDDLDRYLRVGNLNFARATAHGLLKQDPEDAPALSGLAIVESREGHWEAAHDLLLRVKQRAPRHAPTRLQLALVLGCLGRRDEALLDLADLVRGSRLPSHARLWKHEMESRAAHDLAVVWQAAQTARSAEEEAAGESAEWTFLKERFPRNPEVLYLRALRAGEAADDAERIALLEAAVAVDPEHVPAQVALATFLRQTGSPEGAETRLAAALRRRPSDPALLAARAQALEQLGRRDAALGTYRAVFAGALREVPAAALHIASLGLLRTGPRAEARGLLERAAEERRRDPLTHQVVARLDEAEAGPAAAERRLREALRLCGPVPSLHYALGDLLRRQGRRVEAEGVFKALTRRHPQAPWGHRGQGDLLVETEPAKAVAFYAEALRRDAAVPIPGYDYLRGVAGLRAGDAAEARRWLSRAVAGEPDNPRYWCDLGAAFFYDGSLGQALTATHRALDLAPGHPGFCHNLATYYRMQFKAHPIQNLNALWMSWRYGRRARTGKAAGWKRDLWRRPDGSPREEAPPDA